MTDPIKPSPAPEADLSRIRTVPLSGRTNRVRVDDFAGIPRPGGSFEEFLDSLPNVLAAASLRDVGRAVADAVRGSRAVVWMLGGHVVKTGLAPVIVRLMEGGAVTFVAGNGALAIHDYEIARWGATSEDVEEGLRDGSFGMGRETAEEINGAIAEGHREGLGLGEALAASLARRDDLVAPERSLLLAAHRIGIPIGIHAAIGCEITHQHGSADGAAIGSCSMRDFRRLAAHLPGLDKGGVGLNVGSAVILPEVFLKALTVARNLNAGRPREFVTADFDMISHYRPRMNVVTRPTRSGGGRGYQITGHHEIMIPLLAWAVTEYLERP